MDKTSLGNRIKWQYESRSQTLLPRRTYTMIRIDGKSFHSLLKNCKRPYDLGVMSDMDQTAKYLCENIQGCKLAFVQSDEISLVLTDFETITTDAWFDGNVQKITSVSASMAAAKFNQLRMMRIWDKYLGHQDDETGEYVQDEDFEYQRHKHVFFDQKLACFDSRCFVIPDPEEVSNAFIFRQQDCTRNSIQMTGQAYFSHKELQNKSCDDIQEMLFQEKNINWNDMPDGFKRGRCVIRETYQIDNPEDSTRLGARSRWAIVVPPILTQDRDWLWKYIPKIL